ncbi:hypothetical protein [Ligilactobacillus sp. LYQ60]|uniref:hypothetical protein n=1 Tax=Ligilactobacillus sp. LYQ60 TaxID=3378799 RepID=UPI0038522454
MANLNGQLVIANGQYEFKHGDTNSEIQFVAYDMQGSKVSLQKDGSAKFVISNTMGVCKMLTATVAAGYIFKLKTSDLSALPAGNYTVELDVLDAQGGKRIFPVDNSATVITVTPDALTVTNGVVPTSSLSDFEDDLKTYTQQQTAQAMADVNKATDDIKKDFDQYVNQIGTSTVAKVNANSTAISTNADKIGKVSDMVDTMPDIVSLLANLNSVNLCWNSDFLGNEGIWVEWGLPADWGSNVTGHQPSGTNNWYGHRACKANDWVDENTVYFSRPIRIGNGFDSNNFTISASVQSYVYSQSNKGQVVYMVQYDDNREFKNPINVVIGVNDDKSAGWKLLKKENIQIPNTKPWVRFAMRAKGNTVDDIKGAYDMFSEPMIVRGSTVPSYVSSSTYKGG